jgi:hypothetical protein
MRLLYRDKSSLFSLLDDRLQSSIQTIHAIPLFRVPSFVTTRVADKQWRSIPLPVLTSVRASVVRHTHRQHTADAPCQFDSCSDMSDRLFQQTSIPMNLKNQSTVRPKKQGSADPSRSQLHQLPEFN